MPYKILSLDGGGTWALVQARVLKDLYGNCRGHDLLKKFDLAIANSGGSVLLALLCNNRTLDEIITFYHTPAKLKEVFPKLHPWERVLEQLLRLFFRVGPKYSAARKLKGFQKVMPFDPRRTTRNVVNTYLDELPAVIGKNERGRDMQLVISAFDYFRQRATFFRSDKNSAANRFSDAYYRITLGEAIHASTNAPVNYYDAPARVHVTRLGPKPETHDSWFWDGAMAGFNNPVLAGLVEAVTNNADNIPLHDFHILSLGTGQVRKAVITGDDTSNDPDVQQRFEENKGNPLVEWKRNFHFINDIKKTAASILGDPPDSATFIACSFLDPVLRNEALTLVRINPFLTPACSNNIYDYPAAYRGAEDDFKNLMDTMDFDVTDEAGIKRIDGVCDRFIITDDRPCLQNQLIRGEVKGDYLGHPTYKLAKARWLQLM